MLKKSILLATVSMSQLAFASPDQYQTINKSYELSCQTNNDGKTFSSSLTLKAEHFADGVFLVAATELLGRYDINIQLKDQKVLDYKSEDSFPTIYNYTETKYPSNEIIYKNTTKAGFLGREKLQIGLNVKFSDDKLAKGTLKLTTYWPKNNNVTVCSLTEK